MKKTYISLLLGIFCCILSGCTSSQKLTVKGMPGTTIYTPNMKKVGVVENNGKAKITLPRDGYYAYLLSQRNGSDLLIPFALDYTHKSYAGTFTLKNLMYFTAGLGVLASATGAIALAGGDEDIGTAFLVGGIGTTLISAAVGIPVDCRSSQSQYDHKFKYLPWQITNEDMNFMPIVDNGINKTASLEKQDAPAEPHAIDMSASPSSTAKRRTSTSTRSIRDYGKAISGRYVGFGTLSKGNETVERYKEISINITRITANTVSVEVIVDGEPFFNAN
ncbi:MAG: hypothetical protein ACI4TK_15200, partial [Agathobacter sp.]